MHPMNVFKRKYPRYLDQDPFIWYDVDERGRWLKSKFLVAEETREWVRCLEVLQIYGKKEPQK